LKEVEVMAQSDNLPKIGVCREYPGKLAHQIRDKARMGRSRAIAQVLSDQKVSVGSAQHLGLPPLVAMPAGVGMVQRNRGVQGAQFVSPKCSKSNSCVAGQHKSHAQTGHARHRAIEEAVARAASHRRSMGGLRRRLRQAVSVVPGVVWAQDRSIPHPLRRIALGRATAFTAQRACCAVEMTTAQAASRHR
jgi:hypothetical protein